MSAIDGAAFPFPGPAKPIGSTAAEPSRDPDEIGRQFETLFLMYLVKELKLGKSPGLDGGEEVGVPGAQIYEGFITSALAESLSKSGAFGIGKAVAAYVREHANEEGTSTP